MKVNGWGGGRVKVLKGNVLSCVVVEVVGVCGCSFICVTSGEHVAKPVPTPGFTSLSCRSGRNITLSEMIRPRGYYINCNG